jgi:signal transduction histidine kinase
MQVSDDQARARESGGTGLGLAIAQAIARVHGGQISVTSVVGQGSVFTLRLPMPTTMAAIQQEGQP